MKYLTHIIENQDIQNLIEDNTDLIEDNLNQILTINLQLNSYILENLQLFIGKDILETYNNIINFTVNYNLELLNESDVANVKVFKRKLDYINPRRWLAKLGQHSYKAKEKMLDDEIDVVKNHIRQTHVSSHKDPNKIESEISEKIKDSPEIRSLHYRKQFEIDNHANRDSFANEGSKKLGELANTAGKVTLYGAGVAGAINALNDIKDRDELKQKISKAAEDEIEDLTPDIIKKMRKK